MLDPDTHTETPDTTHRGLHPSPLPTNQPETSTTLPQTPRSRAPGPATTAVVSRAPTHRRHSQRPTQGPPPGTPTTPSHATGDPPPITCTPRALPPITAHPHQRQARQRTRKTQLEDPDSQPRPANSRHPTTRHRPNLPSSAVRRRRPPQPTPATAQHNNRQTDPAHGRRPPNPEAPASGHKPIRLAIHKASQARAARTCPNRAWPRQTHPTGRQQRPSPPPERPEPGPGPATGTIHLHPQPALPSAVTHPQTPRNTATKQSAKPQQQEAAQSESRWTPRHKPTSTSHA